MSNHPDRQIIATIEINADIQAVWNAWTSVEGVLGFFAPDCSLDLQPGGKYEMYFDLSAEPGLRGGVGCRIIALQAPTMISFTWNQPPSVPALRAASQGTHVVIRLAQIDARTTRVDLRQDGWGTGEDWDAAYRYFERVWQQVVLPRLKRYLEIGPIDWEKS